MMMMMMMMMMMCVVKIKNHRAAGWWGRTVEVRVLEQRARAERVSGRKASRVFAFDITLLSIYSRKQVKCTKILRLNEAFYTIIE